MREKRRSHSLSAVAGRATELGVLAHPVLQSGSTGVIVAAFQRCFYAAIDGALICVGAGSLGSGPLHVLGEGWPDDRFGVGQRLTITGTVLHIDGALLVDVAGAPIWQPDPAPAWSPASLTAGLQAVGARWRMTFGGEDWAPLGPSSSGRPSHLIAAARPAVDALIRIVENGLRNSPPLSTDGADMAGLIGLGPGLTPSGDDCLLGALVALDGLGLSAVRDSLWHQCLPHLDRTNEISRAHLGAAARGYGAAVLHRAIHATMAGRVEGLEQVLSSVSAIGETSGRDGLTGALMALHAVSRHITDPGRRS